MEKISHIVRGNSRVSSVDLKSSSAVRPGAPSFGRPIGESPSAPDREATTASKAAALHAQMTEQRRSSQDRIVDAMADQFFMSRIRRPAEAEGAVPGVSAGPVKAQTQGPVETDEHEVQAAETDELLQQPSGYTPRGSYINVRA